MWKQTYANNVRVPSKMLSQRAHQCHPNISISIKLLPVLKFVPVIISWHKTKKWHVYILTAYSDEDFLLVSEKICNKGMVCKDWPLAVTTKSQCWQINLHFQFIWPNHLCSNTREFTFVRCKFTDPRFN